MRSSVCKNDQHGKSERGLNLKLDFTRSC